MSQNGKGDRPRSGFNDKYRDNYDQINFKRKIMNNDILEQIYTGDVLNEAVNINKEGLLSLLTTVKGATPATIILQTIPKLNKSSRIDGTAPTFNTDNIRKSQQINGIIGHDYTNSVNNQREREGLERDFVSQNRGFLRVSDAVQEKNGKFYLYMMPRSKDKSVMYVDISNGKEEIISKEKLDPFLPPEKISMPSQGTETIIPHISPLLNNIKMISINNKRYDVID